jgi:dihydropteroate synthase
MVAKNKEIPPIRYSANGKILDLGSPKIMGIINLTPDSFYDGGKYGKLDDVLSDAAMKISQGAAVLDIGAASSRPGATEIPEEEEWNRLKNVLPALRTAFPAVFISVDTYRSEIARRCAALGADIINDIGGGELDADMLAAIAKEDVIYLMMHLDGTPETMRANPPYEDVVRTVKNRFITRTQKLANSGFNRVILDPGFGFGKSLENNYQLLKHINEFTEMGYPVLAGLSRKSMINKVIGTNPVTALNGTTVLNTIALLNGASVLRVHDVEEARQAVDLVEFYKNA